uniref:Ubiquitin carboxyl-terminal hydrolase MINDY n=1 Tax=Salarias fasciatus TaxID=181472 RepID=A0A672JSR2_SALFA
TMVASVEEVSSSLVREYLSRKGLKRTMACLEEELPRTEASINNRYQLRQMLSIENLYRKNKVSLTFGYWPFGKSAVQETCASKSTNKSPLPEKCWLSSHNQTDILTLDLKDRSLVTFLQDSESFIQKEPEKNAFIIETPQRSRTNRIRRGMMAGPIPQELKAVLLGSGLNCFSAEWRNQGFAFSETFDLRYGIVQKKGGPCGVLASIQAFVLKILLFENTEICNNPLQQLKPSNATRRRCLVLALAEILWRAGEEKQATIAINSGRTQFISTRHYKSDGVLEKRISAVAINVFSVCCGKTVFVFLWGGSDFHLCSQFETGAFGCLLLTVSAVLSRSIEKVREDMDVPTTTLIGAHGYCTQELVNLLLCGRSVSNVFDNEMDLDSGNGNVTLLKGIRSQCDVGLLSLFEHYNICKVGAHLKSPRFPIWVVCSESHFSVLFGLQRELLTCEDRGLEFDLYYYDGLANQQEEIRLTVCMLQPLDLTISSFLLYKCVCYFMTDVFVCGLTTI